LSRAHGALALRLERGALLLLELHKVGIGLGVVRPAGLREEVLGASGESVWRGRVAYGEANGTLAEVAAAPPPELMRQAGRPTSPPGMKMRCASNVGEGRASSRWRGSRLLLRVATAAAEAAAAAAAGQQLHAMT
jgi:hypothetical protein